MNKSLVFLCLCLCFCFIYLFIKLSIPQPKGLPTFTLPILAPIPPQGGKWVGALLGPSPHPKWNHEKEWWLWGDFCLSILQLLLLLLLEKLANSIRLANLVYRTCPRRMLYTTHWNKTLVNSSQCCRKAGQSLGLCSCQPHQDTVNQWGVSMSYTMTAEQHVYVLQNLLSKETWHRAIYLSLQWQNSCRLK